MDALCTRENDSSQHRLGCTMVTPVESIQEMYQKQVLDDGKEETNQTASSDEQSEDSNTD